MYETITKTMTRVGSRSRVTRLIKRLVAKKTRTRNSAKSAPTNPGPPLRKKEIAIEITPTMEDAVNCALYEAVGRSDVMQRFLSRGLNVLVLNFLVLDSWVWELDVKKLK